MNIYTIRFFGRCPGNGVRIEYTLEIHSESTVMVESLLAAVENIDHKLHEQIADALLARFGGTQTMTADHHGVQIKTLRGAK